MDKQFICHVKDRMASRFGVMLGQRASKRVSGGGKLYAAELPGAGVCVTLTPLSGRDELMLGLVWPSAASTLGYADLHSFLPTGRRETGFWIDVRLLESVDRSFPSDARFGTHAFLPRPVDFADMVAALAGSKLTLEQLAKRLDYSVEKTQRLLQGYYVEHPHEVTPALRRSLPGWSALGRLGPLPAAQVAKACAHWDALLDCVVNEGVAEFIGLLRKLPRECLPTEPPQLNLRGPAVP